jgi:hypothetical protein
MILGHARIDHNPGSICQIIQNMGFIEKNNIFLLSIFGR